MPTLKNSRQERFAQEVAKGEPYTEAYVIAGYSKNDGNAGRLNRNELIRSRIDEILSDRRANADIDVHWAMEQLKRMFIEASSFNLDDYLGPPDEDGHRYYDLRLVPREKMALLTEMTLETHTIRGGENRPDREVKKIKLKGPDKLPQQRGILETMAKLMGWNAPDKSIVAVTDLRDLLREIDAKAAPEPVTIEHSQDKITHE